MTAAYVQNHPVMNTNLVSEEIFAKVERAKQEWEAAADSLPELICLVTGDGAVIRANRTIETWGRVRIEEVAGQSLHDVLHPGCLNASCYLRELIQPDNHNGHETDSRRLEVYDPRLKMHVLARQRRVTPVRQLECGPTVIILQDITERKLAEEMLQRFTVRLQTLNDVEQAILTAQSPEEIAQVVVDGARRLITCQRASVCLKETAGDSIVILAVNCAEPTDLPSGRRLFYHELPADDIVRTSGTRPIMGNLDRFDGLTGLNRQLFREGIRSFLRVPLVSDGETIGSLNLGAGEADAFTRDDVEIAEDLADLLTIATRQAQLFRIVQQTNAALKEALRAKDQMIQNVSHELRSPLAVIKGYTELLRAEQLGPLTADQAEALDVLDSEEQRLHYMVNRLIALNALDIGALQAESISPAGLLADAVNAWRTRAHGMGIELVLEKPAELPHIVVDPKLLHQVLYNLIDNAFKFSPHGGYIRISAHANQNELLISVSDQGVGLEPRLLERIFEQFYQVDGGPDRAVGGMGIGLALCRKIIEAHDGRIWAESPGPGKGSVFRVVLPLRSPRLQTFHR